MAFLWKLYTQELVEIYSWQFFHFMLENLLGFCPAVLHEQSQIMFFCVNVFLLPWFGVKVIIM